MQLGTRPCKSDVCRAFSFCLPGRKVYRFDNPVYRI